MSFVVRIAHASDLEPLYEMAKLAGGGFTNLPAERPALAAKLENSDAACSRESDSLADELFVLVLEDSESRELRGTAQMFTQVGQSWPFYSYRLSVFTQHSRELNRTVRTELLSLVTDLEGSSEVGGLFLRPSSRAAGLGLLLARSRYLFIASHRARFGDRVLAELRGVIDERGSSPFWDAVGGRFFGMSFEEADRFNALGGNQFIADLMPKHPLYVAMLPESARQVIGRPHPNGRAAMRMLENEGFAYEGYVDIFDGGPTLTARTDAIASIAGAREAEVVDLALDQGETALIAAGRLAGFRCCYGMREFRDGGAAIDATSAELLRVGAGDRVWSVGR